MFAQQSPLTLRQRMSMMTYTTMYTNLVHRLQWREERLDYDFFVAQHCKDPQFIQKHLQPTAYGCPSKLGYLGNAQIESVYLVVSNGHDVVLLLEPHEAQARNLPFLSILDDRGFFRPYLGSATEFWQTRMEPMDFNPGSVLQFSAVDSHFENPDFETTCY